MRKTAFSGLGQGMALAVAAAAANGFTPAALFVEILKGKNEVSNYFESRLDINNLILDFQDTDVSSSEAERLESSLEKMLSDAARISGDRFITEIKFMGVLLDDSQFNRYFTNILGKYLKPQHVKEDIREMVNPQKNLVWEKQEVTILDFIGKDLTAMAEAGEISPVIGRDEEVSKMIQILIRQTKANPILTGEAGVGKTALVEKLALLMQDPVNLPSSLHGYRLYEISVPAIMSTESVEKTIAEMVEVCSRNKIILFIDEVHLIMNNDAKIANLLKPAMARGSFKLIGATTDDEYKVFEGDKAITRRFQPVHINESDKMEVFQILISKAQESEMVHNVLIPKETLLKVIDLSERYMPSRKQPDKALDLLEQSSAKLRMIIESKPEVLIEVERKLSDAIVESEMIMVQFTSRDIPHRTQVNLDDLEANIEKYTIERDKLAAEYAQQRVLLDAMISAKKLLADLQQAEKDELHRGNFEEATELKLVEIPAAEKALLSQEEALLEFAKTTDENLIQNVVTPSMIARVIEDQTGIPVSAQGEDDIEKYHHMEDTIKKVVKGQSRAVDKIVAAIKRSKAGLSDPNKPLGSFMSLGPTGVGKTLMAEQIAEFMFDTKNVIHRFDMSEFQEPHSVARLFGSPPGYVGHDKGGQLTEAVKRNPYCIILFDEIEKAHKKVFDTLLQILDAGRMTDGQGNVINFKNTIIMMTSNLGSKIIRDGYQSGYEVDVIEVALLDEIKKHFKPEFLNRFDAKVMFNALMPKDVLRITDVELNKLADRLLKDNDIEIHWHPDIPVYITNEAYDINDGARPIKRYINDTILNAISELILSREATSGDTLFITLGDDGKMLIGPIEPSDVSEMMPRLEMTLPLQGYVAPSPTQASVQSLDLSDEEKEAESMGLVGTKKKKKKKKRKLPEFNLDTETD